MNLLYCKDFYLFLISFFALLVTVESIKCYRCNSIDTLNTPYQCNEFFDDSQLQPESCDDVHNAQYCIKQTGVFDGALITRRFCSSDDLGNYCNYIPQPGDVRVYRSCYFTCSADGCNSAVTAAKTGGGLIALAALLPLSSLLLIPPLLGLA